MITHGYPNSKVHWGEQNAMVPNGAFQSQKFKRAYMDIVKDEDEHDKLVVLYEKLKQARVEQLKNQKRKKKEDNKENDEGNTLFSTFCECISYDFGALCFRILIENSVFQLVVIRKEAAPAPATPVDGSGKKLKCGATKKNQETSSHEE